jgi:transposase
MRTGAQWRELPKYYVNFKTVHKQFLSWAKKDIWNSILSFLKRDCDTESIMIDGSVIRAHACASG